MIIENDKDTISLINTYARTQRLLSSTFRKREHPKRSKGRNPWWGISTLIRNHRDSATWTTKGNKLIDFLLQNSLFVQNL